MWVIKVYHYGMQSSHRTSFALDEKTMDNLKQLSRRWNVSQAEVVRRAVSLAAETAAEERDSVLDRLKRYREDKRLNRGDVETVLAELRAARRGVAGWTA